jgi:hypothetical protein
MTMANNGDNDITEMPAPTKLVEALRRTQSARVFVPPAVEEAILRAARNQLAPTRQPSRSPFAPWLRWSAFATACALLVFTVYQFTRPKSSSPDSRQPLAREDVNRDGHVNILDAFQLARQVESGAKPSLNSDVNADGVVDRRDAELIAAQAVKLEKGGRS